MSKGTHQGHRIAFLDFLIFLFVRKNNDFAEFKVHLIHRKHVPLLHNTLLILCDEGDGLVAVDKRGIQNQFSYFSTKTYVVGTQKKSQ